jgi:DNA-binding transcriptional LysR family regulator
MDMRDLRYLCALAEHGNISRAAEALGLTQPALTRRVQAVEAELNVRLFDRHAKGVTPTSYGDLVVRRSGDLLHGIEGIRHEIDSIRELKKGHVTLGAGAVVAQAIVGEAVAALVRTCPELSVRVLVDSIDNALAALRAGKVELLVGNLTPCRGEPDLEIMHDFEHSGYFICRAGHPILALESPTLDDVFSYPFVSVSIPQPFARTLEEAFGRRLQLRVECDSYPVLKTVIGASDAISISSRYAVIDELRAGKVVEIPMKGPVAVTRFGVVRMANRTPSPGAMALAAELAESARTVLRWSAEDVPPAVPAPRRRRSPR